MALIGMAVHDTEQNERSKYTRETLNSLLHTVDFSKHRLVISDNGSCEETKQIYKWFKNELCLKVINEADVECDMTVESIELILTPGYNNHGKPTLIVINNGENLGTAKAVNKAMAYLKPGEHFIKMDNDVVFYTPGWVDLLEDAMQRPTAQPIGILGLKRKDLAQCPWNEEHPSWKTTIHMLPHEKGQRWLVVENSVDVMGTCTMFNPQLIAKIGGLRQPGVYGWDDVDYSIRSLHAGFTNAFLLGVEIDHIDTGDNDYAEWKRKEAARTGSERKAWETGYTNGTTPIFQPYIDTCKQ